MKKILLTLGMLLMTAPMARADLVHRMSSSTQLTVNGAYTDSSRIGSTYAVSGSNIKVDTSNSGHFGALTAGVVADMPSYGETLTMSGGVAGTLAGTITSAGVTTLTAGGAGTTATGQFVTEIILD